jgi:hypothetical protein
LLSFCPAFDGRLRLRVGMGCSYADIHSSIAYLCQGDNPEGNTRKSKPLPLIFFAGAWADLAGFG